MTDLKKNVAGAVTKLIPGPSKAPQSGIVLPSPIRIWTPEQIWAPIPPAAYTIDGILRQANLALVTAFGSSLKTWLLVDAVVAVATGTDFLGRFACGCPGESLILDWESGQEELRRRLQLVSRGRGLVGPVPGVSFVTMPDLYFTSPRFEEELTSLARGKRLVAFDSLAAGSVGVDENDARFATGLQSCKRVAEATGAAMLVLHHAKKTSGDGPGDERMAVRGTGAIFAAADAVLNLRRRRDDEDDDFVVTQSKARGGRRVDAFRIRIEDAQNGGAVVVASDVAEAPKSMSAGASILRALAGAGAPSKSELVRMVGARRSGVLAEIARLEAEGFIVQHEGRLRLASEVSE